MPANTKPILSKFKDATNELTLISLREQAYWDSYIKNSGFKSLFEFVSDLTCDNHVNVFDYQHAANGFRHLSLPTNWFVMKTVMKGLKETKLVIDLTDPMMGMNFYIAPKDGSAKIRTIQDGDEIVLKGKYCSLHLMPSKPNGKIVIINSTSACKVISDFANKLRSGDYKFVVNQYNNKPLLNEDELGKIKVFRWAGNPSENGLPIRDYNRNPYHLLSGAIVAHNQNSDFTAAVIDCSVRLMEYMNSINNHSAKISNALAYGYIPTTITQRMLVELRDKLLKHKIRSRNNTKTVFVPYLDLEQKPGVITFGIISR